MKHDFQYISKNNKDVKQRYKTILCFLKDVQREVKSEFTFRYDVVGSYKRNMITFDKKSNVGYDFDFNIEINDYGNVYTAKKIKNILQNTMNKCVDKYGYGCPENSTRVLTIKCIDHEHSKIIHSVDFAVVNNYEDEEGYQCQEYIRFNKNDNSYSWCEQGEGYYMLSEKEEWIKDNNLWEEFKDHYLYMKNKNDNPDLHSRSILAMSVNNICNEYGYYD